MLQQTGIDRFEVLSVLEGASFGGGADDIEWVLCPAT